MGLTPRIPHLTPYNNPTAPTAPASTAPTASTPRSAPAAPAAEDLLGVLVALAVWPLLVASVVVLVTLPLTASATAASPVLRVTDPSLAVTVWVTVAVCVIHVQPAPQSPQPPNPAPPAPPTHGLPSHAHPVTVTLWPVNVLPQSPHPGPPAPPTPPGPAPPAPPPPPAPPGPMAPARLFGDGVAVGVAVAPPAVPVAKGHARVYTPVEPAAEQLESWEHSDEARLL